jgi:hypothetical protein
LVGWWFMVFNSTFNNIFQVYLDGQFYWGWKPEYSEKTTDLSRVTDKIDHMLKQVNLAMNDFGQLTTDTLIYKFGPFIVSFIISNKKLFQFSNCLILSKNIT